ncbi:hypothetical protein AMTRI_Chr03g140140 [Amborella trichopoda]
MERSKMNGVLLLSILVVGLVAESSASEFHESLSKICFKECLKKGKSKLECTTYCLGHIKYAYQKLHRETKKASFKNFTRRNCFDAQISSN